MLVENKFVETSTLVQVEPQWLSRLLVNYSWFQSFIMFIMYIRLYLGLDFWHQFEKNGLSNVVK